MPIHQAKLRKVVTQTIGVTMGIANPQGAVRVVMPVYAKDGYDVESVDGKAVHRCDGCGGLIFDGEGVASTDGKLSCPKCLDVVQPDSVPAVSISLSEFLY